MGFSRGARRLNFTNLVNRGDKNLFASTARNRSQAGLQILRLFLFVCASRVQTVSLCSLVKRVSFICIEQELHCLRVFPPCVQ